MFNIHNLFSFEHIFKRSVASGSTIKKKDANPMRLSIVLSHHMHRN